MARAQVKRCGLGAQEAAKIASYGIAALHQISAAPSPSWRAAAAQGAVHALAMRALEAQFRKKCRRPRSNAPVKESLDRRAPSGHDYSNINDPGQ
jgi:hypothetical protein